MKTYCEHCEEQFDATGSRGRTPKFCSSRCRLRAHRAKKLALPDVMRNRAAWVRADGKRPIMPDGSPASSTNSATWSPFDSVQRGAGDGFGIMLGDGVGCYDLDHCYTGGVLDDWARDYVGRIGEPVLFVERSLSGEGLHVFVEAEEQPGRKMMFRGGSVEFYTRQRFIRTTLDMEWR